MEAKMFEDFFAKATANSSPYPYQRAFAEDCELPDLESDNPLSWHTG